MRRAAVREVDKASKSYKLWLAGGLAAGAGALGAVLHTAGAPAGWNDAQEEDAAARASAALQSAWTRAAAVVGPSDETAGAAKERAARLLSRWSEDPESREALLAVGGTRLLNFLLDLSTEDPSAAQAAGESVVCDLLASHHCASRLLQRPGAVPRLLEHVAAGKGSDRLAAALSTAAASGGADLGVGSGGGGVTAAGIGSGGAAAGEHGLHVGDARALVRLLNSRNGQEVQALTARFIEAWARTGPTARAKLAAAGLNPALAAAASAAVPRGDDDGGRALRMAVVRVVRLMELDAAATTDADRAGWARPVLFIAADAAAAGDLALADTAMQTVVHAARTGGPLVRSALRELHLMPTIEALAGAADPKLRVRAAAALAPLMAAGLVPLEVDQAAWRDRLLQWLIDGDSSSGGQGSGRGAVAAAEGAAAEAADGGDKGEGLSLGAALRAVGNWWRSGGVGRSARRVDAGAEELRRACVSGLKALAHQPGPAGLYVAHLWLARLLEHLAEGLGPEGPAAVAAAEHHEREQQRAAEEAPVRDPWVQLREQQGSRAGGPATAAGAAAAAAELRAAAAAVAGSWRGASLSLPPDVQPGLFTPAVLEAYPAAARAVDAALARSSARSALELVCSIVADDAAKQQWLVDVGVLPMLERLCLFPELPPNAASSAGSGASGGRAAAGAAAKEAAAGSGASRALLSYLWWGGQKQDQGSEVDQKAKEQQQQGGQQTQQQQDLEVQTEGQPDKGGQQQQTEQQQQQQQQQDKREASPRSWWSYLPGVGGGGSSSSSGGSFSAHALSPGGPTPSAQATAKESQPAASPAAAAVEAVVAAAQQQGPSGLELVAAAEEAALPPSAADDSALGLNRQAARLLSLLCLLPAPARHVARDDWLQWLRTGAAADDCRLSSYATCALLHLESCLHHHPASRSQAPGAAMLGALGAQAAADLGALLEDLWPFGSGDTGGTASSSGSGGALGGGSGAAASGGSGSSGGAAAAWRPPASYADGVHLLVPSDPHHWAVVRHHPAGLMESIAAAANAALASAAEDLGGLPDLEGDGGDAAAEVRRARGEHLARAVAGAAAGLRAAAAALRGEDALSDAGLGGGETACSARGTGTRDVGAGGAVTGSSGLSAGAAVAPPPPIGPKLTPLLPECDVVFIHGVRGGPFVSWRRGNAMAPGAARANLTHGDCWPSAWLAGDLPGARLLSIEYNAPVTGWEGGDLSVPERARVVLDKLLAAGVGQRPVVFVTHSMGGLMLKEMLSLSLDAAASNGPRARLASSLRGVVFFATPHFGSRLAELGVKLRHVPGAVPAPAVHHLAPGPHLELLNEQLRALHDAGQVAVLSFAEGLPTPIAGFIPRVVVVPYASAFPGYGAVRVVPTRDHIDICKPSGKDDPLYADVLAFVRDALGTAAGGEGPGGAAAGEAAVAAAEAAAAAAAAGVFSVPKGNIGSAAP